VPEAVNALAQVASKALELLHHHHPSGPWTLEALPGLEIKRSDGTCRVLERLGKQAPGAMDAYEKLLPHQPEIYRTHLGWLENHSPEEVREAMLTIRCRDAGTLAEFERLLGESKARRRNR
jgi:hypothetical protein